MRRTTAEAAPTPRRRRANGWRALRQFKVLLAVALLLVVDVFDSFGLDQAADEQVARIIGTVQAPLYGGADRIGQDGVAVVLIDEASLHAQGWDTPPPYLGQADLIGLIAAHQPAAIFMDFTYRSPHGDNPEEDIASLVATLDAVAEETGQPVFTGPVGEDPLLAPLAQAAGRETLDVAWQSPTWLDYPMRGDAGRPMAAAGLHAAYCGRFPDRCAPGAPAPDANLYVTWGFGASADAAPLYDRQTAQTCVLKDMTWAHRLRVAAERAFYATLRAAAYDPQRGDPVETRCFYADTVTASQVLNGSVDDVIGPILRDRVVLVGASYQESADKHAVPYVGVVPGVMIHAMALDNLMTEGAQVTQMPPPLFFALDQADAVELGLTAALFAAAFWTRRRLEGPALSKDKAKPVLLVAAVLAGLVLVITGVSLAIQALASWPALNVIGVASIALTAVFVFDDEVFDLVASEENV